MTTLIVILLIFGLALFLSIKRTKSGVVVDLVVNLIEDGQPVQDIHNLKLINNNVIITQGFSGKNIIFESPVTQVQLELKQEVTPEEREIIDKDKSVIGRAVVGGLILGPVGAVVGGMSGLGTKKQEIVTQKEKKDIYISLQGGCSRPYLLKVHKANQSLAYTFYDKVQSLNAN